MQKEIAINVEGCPVSSINPRAYGPTCGDEQTHTIMRPGIGPVRVCWTHARMHDAGRALNFTTEEPARVASNG
jgi:hypothetical protein